MKFNSEIISLESLEQNAFVPTKHLLSSVKDYNIENKDTFIIKNERQIQNFIYTTTLFEDYPNNLYSDAVTKENISKFESEIAYRYIFKKEKLEHMLYEVFGISNWSFDNLNMEFDSQNNTYVTGLEFEFGIICDVNDEMDYHFDRDNNTLEVIARVSYYGESDENGDPAFGSYQKKRFLYHVCVEGERTYLRLLKETDSM